MRKIRLAGAVAAALGVLLAAAPAWAHVEIEPGEAEQGSFAVVTFNVPNETSDAKTTAVKVQFPEDHPIPFVSVEPVPGWTVATQSTTLAEPVESEGEQITEAVSTITWSADGTGIEPGQFQRFPVSMGPLPEDADALEFKAIQTYDNGDVVRWIEATPASGEEPELPAPVLTLTAAGGEGGDHAASTDTTVAADQGATDSAAAEATSAQDDADSATTLATIGLIVGALGLIAGVSAIVLGRRKSAAA